MNLWKKIKNWALDEGEFAKENANEEPLPMQYREYHPKIILAWSAGIDGNNDLLKWLGDNGYFELIKVTEALYGKNTSRKWLMLNGFPHLAAFVSALEGRKKAQEWLEENGMEEFMYIAQAIANEDDDEVEFAQKWIGLNCTEDKIVLFQSIYRLYQRDPQV